MISFCPRKNLSLQNGGESIVLIEHTLKADMTED